MQNVRYVPVGFEQLSASALGNATGLTPPATAQVAVMSVTTAAVRYRDDGTPPSASTGTVLVSGSLFEYWGDLGTIELIGVTGSPVVDVSFYRVAG